MEENRNSPFTPRRTQRLKKPSLKAIENKICLENANIFPSDDGSDEEREVILDSVLDSQAASVGKDIFSLQKKKKLSIMDPKYLSDEEMSNDSPLPMKTPHKLRKKLKRGILNCIKNESSGEEAFSESDSEYSPSNSSNEESVQSESEASSQQSSDENSDDSARPRIKKKEIETPSNLRGRSTRSKSSQKEYVIKTDEYFANNASSKVKTSNHTLDKLKTPRLSQEQLQKLLVNMKISKQHQNAMCNFSENNRSHFNKWMYILHENFNILLFGLGSKRTIIQDFQKQFLQDLPVIVINGFFPSLTLKEILDGIIDDILDLKDNPGNNYEACDLIVQEFMKIPDTHLYMIIHNIEGEMLRNQKSQNILAKLASVKNIHLIASIDHINAPLIWNHNNLSKFNFTWWDVTSFLPYSNELSFESSMMVQRSGSLALSSLRNVFLSLTTNSKGIYLTIVKHQLQHGGNQYYQGMLFKDLYWACRETFLVSSDLALRAQLTEFIDHKMVKSRRSLDGAEYLIIPIANALLQQFLTEQEK